MHLWWGMSGKSSSKDLMRRSSRGSFIDAIHRKLKSSLQGKHNSKAGGSERFTDDIVSQQGLAQQRSALTSLQVSRCQSFAEESHAQPLPLPEVCLADDTESFPMHGYDLEKPLASDAWGDLATALVSSNRSFDTNDILDSRVLSPLASDYGSEYITAINSPSRTKDQVMKEPPTSGKRQGSTVHLSKLHIPPSGFFSTPESLICSPARSPVRACFQERVRSSGVCSRIPCSHANLITSGHRCSPSSGQTCYSQASGCYSVGGDMPLLRPQSRCSPESSPIPSPKIASTGPCSRIQSGAVTPLHPQAGGLASESHMDKPANGMMQTYRLPLPPVCVSTSAFSHSYSAIATSCHLKNPGCTESSTVPASPWRKGCLIGTGTFGRVYKCFNSETGEICAMKEVTLFSDDATSKENLQQLGQEITLLSYLRHPNIVRYIGSKTADDMLIIYLEYVSGGSILNILREYGQLGESAIRSFTWQILHGLAYLHDKNIVHRDIKGANILVDPNGTVKLADFGMAKHISGQSCPLSFKGSPYWMAPEVVRNSNGYNLAVDIWSLGCTVIEMATAKPPWSQYEGVAALFKIANSKELPTIPDNLSDEGKDFVRQCLQRNPQDRPTAAQLLKHPFARTLKSSKFPLSLSRFTNVASHKDKGHRKKLPHFNSGVHVQLCNGSKIASGFSKSRMPKHVSCPVSPIGSPLLRTNPTQPTCSSASSKPYTGGYGAFPMHPLTHSRVTSYEGVGFKHPQKGLHASGTTLCTKPTSKTSRGIFETLATRSGTAGSQFVQPVHSDPRERCDRHTALVDHVSQQLLLNI